MKDVVANCLRPLLSTLFAALASFTTCKDLTMLYKSTGTTGYRTRIASLSVSIVALTDLLASLYAADFTDRRVTIHSAPLPTNAVAAALLFRAWFLAVIVARAAAIIPDLMKDGISAFVLARGIRSARGRHADTRRNRWPCCTTTGWIVG